MIVGDPNVFAIESSILIAYERLGARALGFFLLHLDGFCYGVREPDATLLACSLGEVERRLAERGKHVAPFAEVDAEQIAQAFRVAFYSEETNGPFFGLSHADFSEYVWGNHIVWAPDGDEAFDDGSYVLQFDLGERVRLVGFRSQGFGFDPLTLRDVWLPAPAFYEALQRWRDAFLAEWSVAPKAAE